MDTVATAFIVAVSLIGGLGVFAVAAMRWGVDSRPTIKDTHAR
jgi:hypothetical protein